jgi:O-antigen/teichoic acid export membrane protein
LILILPIAIITTLFAEQILFLLYGKGFEQAASTLQVLVWTGVMFPVANIFGNALIASHRQNIDLWVNSIGAVFNVCLNLILIPRYSHFGAGLATLISISFFIVIQYYIISKILFKIHFLETIIKPFVAAVAMTISIILLKTICLPAAILTGLFFYVFILIIFKSISNEEIGQFKNVWKEKKMLFLIEK